jgi:MSHA biogenesis protein MshI
MERNPVFSWLQRSRLDGWVAVVPHGDTAQALYLHWPLDGRPQVRWACRLDWSAPLESLRLLRRQRTLQRHHRLLVLQRHQYQLLPTEAPEVPREHWPDAVRWQLRDLVAFPVADAQIDLLEIPAETNQRGRPSVLAALAPRQEVAPIAETALRARAPWKVMDLPETALRNLAALLEEPGRGIALLLIDDTHCTLVITASGELLQSRHIDVTAAQIAEPDETLRQQAFDRAGLELQRTLDSFERLFSRVTLSRLVVATDTSDAFTDYVRELLYVPVVRLHIEDCIDFTGAELDSGLTPSTVSPIAIGAALRRG